MLDPRGCIAAAVRAGAVFHFTDQARRSPHPGGRLVLGSVLGSGLSVSAPRLLTRERRRGVVRFVLSG
ncbi:hypothetical protein FHX82_006999 [Amycolatopsis bartoniae]|uniref:Uncharacterized protein n=1 Tax=Amycolatopsis bartoniae TaxID=941986 RepID=A0A8H9IMZ7_9PSEU|nr:hypothetical protein [Amycolatopsis bartoniae]MBB2939913.1 hypothetical protein [Amycolatopsis bartoniae]TVT08303.1 hypothetical protein FNH07_12800 [Amycolatopsis bartoniae]GHF35716.1 hypothetical protein GCM10017566_05820 [Amycolatopsis bartoniae]